MKKWLYEILYACALRKSLHTSFWKALRFVRCDYLIQQDVERRLLHQRPNYILWCRRIGKRNPFQKGDQYDS